MKLSITPLPSPEHELASDEALLDACDQGNGPEVLRFWEPRSQCVVVGYANSVELEVNCEFCAAHGIPVFRRCTGGGTVLQGPGCLNYSLILRAPASGPLSTITGTNRYIMDRHAMLLARLSGEDVRVEGYTDLAVGGRKFSGNAQRRKMRALLFHGCFLLRVDLPLISAALKMPSKQPDYRQSRKHHDFVRNLEVAATGVTDGLRELWGASEIGADLPRTEIERLVQEKYSRSEWNWKF